MKKIKIIIDVIMVICMLLLMDTNITGLQTHEILGIGILIIFIIHKIINFKWIKSISKNFFNKKLQVKSKVLFILNLLLFIFTIACVITGILISQYIFTEITVNNIRAITVFHKCFAWWSLILISIHIGFHWKSFVNYFTSKFKILKDNVIMKVILKTIYVVIAISGIIVFFKKDIYTNLIPINDNSKNLNGDNRNFDDTYINQKYNIKNNDEEQDFKREDKKHNKNRNYNYKENNELDEEESEKNNSNLTNGNVQTISLTDNTTSGGTPTLNEFLSKITCTECGKRCILTNPQCGRGVSYQAEKIQEYNQLYGNSEDVEENDNTSDSNSFARNKQNNNLNEITKANISGISVIDYISIMGLFIGGTYYFIDIIENRKKYKE